MFFETQKPNVELCSITSNVDFLQNCWFQRKGMCFMLWTRVMVLNRCLWYAQDRTTIHAHSIENEDGGNSKTGVSDFFILCLFKPWTSESEQCFLKSHIFSSLISAIFPATLEYVVLAIENQYTFKQTQSR